MPSTVGVATRPGTTASTRMPAPPQSAASDRVSPRTPALAAAQPTRLGRPSRPLDRVGDRAARAVVVGEVGRDGRLRSRQVGAHDLGTHVGARVRQGPPRPARGPGHQDPAPRSRHRRPPGRLFDRVSHAPAPPVTTSRCRRASPWTAGVSSRPAGDPRPRRPESRHTCQPPPAVFATDARAGGGAPAVERPHRRSRPGRAGPRCPARVVAPRPGSRRRRGIPGSRQPQPRADHR
ncbi:MAG: hypothetical protein QOC93_2670 [Actinomycetota bacterium]|nr:hypothetical protein [Actinomycetota bacterium]